jgi:hypothetical protein
MPLVCAKAPGITLDLAMWPSGLGGGAARENPGEVLAGEGWKGGRMAQGSRGLDLGASWRRGEDRRVGTSDTDGGGRWRLCSGEPAVRPGQRVRGGAPVGPREAA